MFSYLFVFEIRYWLRQPMVYIFMLVNVLMFAWAAASDDLTIGGSFGNIHKNAPYVIQTQYSIWCLFALLMTTAFVQNAAIRDFSYKTNQIIFSSPIRKFDYLAGRFLGSYLVSLIPFLGISLGILLGTMIGLATGSMDVERYGPVAWLAHLNSFLVFAIPNTFISGAFIFTLAALTRSTIVSFIGAILLIVVYGISSSFLSDVENEKLAFFVDAFGARPFDLITKYWTVSDKNTRSVGLDTLQMLMNRLIWMGLGAGLLVFTYLRFSFADRAVRISSRQRKRLLQEAEQQPLFTPLQALPTVHVYSTGAARLTQLWHITRSEFWGIVTSTAFIVILLAGMMNMGFSLQYADQTYGLMSYPVTYQVIDLIRGTMYIFLIAIIVFYSGSVIWKERDADLDQIYDAMTTPCPTAPGRCLSESCWGWWAWLPSFS
jgi:ABC-type transport system involved in multi-copper enzyme maturation permease subunit